MKFLYSLFLIFSLAMSTASGQSKDRTAEVSSPDGEIKVTVRVSNGVPTYKVQRQGQAIVNDSKLGFLFKDQPGLAKDFALSASKKSSFDQTWTQPWGEVKDIRNNYN